MKETKIIQTQSLQITIGIVLFPTQDNAIGGTREFIDVSSSFNITHLSETVRTAAAAAWQGNWKLVQWMMITLLNLSAYSYTAVGSAINQINGGFRFSAHNLFRPLSFISFMQKMPRLDQLNR